MTQKRVNCTHPCLFVSSTTMEQFLLNSSQAHHSFYSKMHTSYTEQEAPSCNRYQAKQDLDWGFLNGSYVTEGRLAWGRGKGESSVSFNFHLKEKTRNSENQHNPGIIQKRGGEEGQSEERDCNTFLLWMRFYSCLLQCCRKSGWDKEDHLHSEGHSAECPVSPLYHRPPSDRLHKQGP